MTTNLEDKIEDYKRLLISNIKLLPWLKKILHFDSLKWSETVIFKLQPFH